MQHSLENNEYSKPGSKMPLLKVLMAAGLGSRRYLAKLIMDNKVRVNNVIVQNLSHPVDPAINTIQIDGKILKPQPMTKYVLLLNKPAGILSTTSDDRGRNTVIDILPSEFQGKGLYPVGRLDKDSTGLLIITNDGDLTYKLTHPKFEHEKEYLVSVRNRLTLSELNVLEKGIELDDGFTYPSRIREFTQQPQYCYSIIIHEGRKNQIRRMFEKVGHQVLSLHRIRIGCLELGNIKEGQTKKLTQVQIKILLQKSKSIG